MPKTYALLDVVGVKDALKAGKGPALLKEFWQTTDAWTTGLGNSFRPAPLLDGSAEQVPHVSVVTFSDSALLFTRPEFRLDVFYTIVGSLKQKLTERLGRVYCIVSRDEEVEHPAMPALGGTVMGSDMKPAYFNVAGSGAAWVNLHLADRAIGRRKDWHDKYSLYAVGANSIPPGGAAREEETFKMIDGGDAIVAALA